MKPLARVTGTLAAAALVCALVVATPGAAAAIPEGMLPGIDVSHWQGTIDWPTLATSGVSFAIARATQGTAVDATYATNLAGASDNAIPVAAYHVAQPSSATGDALSEADAFLSAARNAAGDVLPALDIEATGGLSVADLQTWVRTWLTEVRSELGVHPMIYTSPNFWQVSVGDTEWFANHGYPLWIAHWNVKSPTVPANNWGGHGWTFWQWNNCWSRPGITGCVDGDRFLGTDIRGGEISQLSVTPNTGGIVTGSRISCGDGSSVCTRLANPGDLLALTATPDEGVGFLGWTGACEPAGTSSACTVTMLGSVETSGRFGYPFDITVSGSGVGTVTSSPAGIACPPTCSAGFAYGSSVSLTASPDSASSFIGWTGACSGTSQPCVIDATAPATLDAQFDAPPPLEEAGAGTRFLWATRSDPRAIGGSYVLDHRAGASVSYPFSGDAVTVYTIAGPSMGKARVAIDDVTIVRINGYAASFASGVARTFSGFGAGDHTISITALGTRSRLASGTQVGVDALEGSGHLRRTPRPSSGSWSGVSSVSASGGMYVIDDVGGASATLRFTGTAATWITAVGPSMGRARIYVDGSLVKSVDLYSPSFLFGVERTVVSLPDTDHVLRIEVVGTSRNASTGTDVAVDGWMIR